MYLLNSLLLPRIFPLALASDREGIGRIHGRGLRLSVADRNGYRRSGADRVAFGIAEAGRVDSTQGKKIVPQMRFGKVLGGNVGYLGQGVNIAKTDAFTTTDFDKPVDGNTMRAA